MAPLIFDGARLKAERAQRHIEAIQALLGDLVAESDLFATRTEVDPESGRNIFAAEIKEIPALKFVPVIIGDAVHNLHCVLDHMHWAITDAVGTPGRYTRFPFKKSRKELVDALNGGEIRKAGSAVIDYIVDGIRPYAEGGDDLLVGLHELDIIDKHRLTIPFITSAEVESRFRVDEGEVFTLWPPHKWTVTSTGEQRPISAAADAKITGDHRTTFEVVFREDSPFKREPVVPILSALLLKLDGIVMDMERICAEKGIVHP